MHQDAVVPELHASLQTQRDQQPYRDCRKMNEKIPPAMQRFTRRMHFNHSSLPSYPAASSAACCAAPPSLSNPSSLATQTLQPSTSPHSSRTLPMIRALGPPT